MQRKPRLLDLFCGAGGCAVGYHRAGFEVVGVDIAMQKNYPFEFHQGDALEFLAAHGREFDAIHASPPCQAFTQMSARYRGKGGLADSRPNLLTPTLETLAKMPHPWIVENVPGARRLMGRVTILHGGMFGLGVNRPRLFESNYLLLAPTAQRTVEPIGVYGKLDGRIVWRNGGNYRAGVPGSASRSVIRVARTLEEGRRVMGIDWMEWSELREAIPPAYTEYLGKQLLAVVKSTDVA